MTSRVMTGMLPLVITTVMTMLMMLMMRGMLVMVTNDNGEDVEAGVEDG